MHLRRDFFSLILSSITTMHGRTTMKGDMAGRIWDRKALIYSHDLIIATSSASLYAVGF